MEQDGKGDAVNSKEYYEFISKFEARHTTDDCYTPPAVYDTVAGWVAKRYNLDQNKFIRPFVPGGDYQAQTYPPDSVVVDNPPFSILTSIVKWYAARGIRFFLFAPALTTLKPWLAEFGVCAICAATDITYDNGCRVATSFLTNMEPDRVVTMSSPELYTLLRETDKNNQKKQMPKYKYPDEVLTAAMLNYLSMHGVEYQVSATDTAAIATLDSQREAKKTIFGGGFLLSEKAAAEKAAAEKAAAICWTLSERERNIIKKLG